MNLLQKLRSQGMPQFHDEATRSGLVNLFETWQGDKVSEKIEEDFVSYVRDGMQANGVIWALILMRMTFFAQAEFRYQNIEERILTNDPSLKILANPWPNGSTQELLARMEQDVSTAGNSYIYKAQPDRLQRLRPDWMEIVTDGSELVAYAYSQGGISQQVRKKILLPDEVAHWSPYPDPLANFRGMSWITPVVREVLADKQMTKHKQKFFDNAATPNLLIKNTKNLDEEGRIRLRRQLETRHEGPDNAYRTLVLEGGADATIIGATMQQMAFDAVQAAGENRIASAAGVPGIVAGFKEGLQAATYSNYAQAKRHYVDGTLVFNWGSVSKALETLVSPGEGERLWYDTDHIPALKEDRKDAADIAKNQAFAIMQLVRVGFVPTDVEAYVLTGQRPVGGIKHTGMIFYQGAEAEPPKGGGTGLVAEQPGGSPTATMLGAPAPTPPPPAVQSSAADDVTPEENDETVKNAGMPKI